MFKLPIQNYYVRDKLDNHEEMKSQVLSLIDNSSDGSLEEVNENYNNKISKLDWQNNADFERPWVKLILPSLIKKLGEMAYSIGYHSVFIKALWYQQYTKDSIHDWHVHSENYTGVYYLEYPEGAPPTKLFGNELTVPNVNEGDVVMFPAMTPHQAPMIKNDVRKTIISYNFNMSELNLDKLKEVRYGSIQ
tara:strand:- start:61 stop:633 length:573 start_codon:yes stop_codon:yes gene_type:complete